MSEYFWQVSAYTPLRVVLLVDLASAMVAHALFRKYEPRDITSCLVRLAIFAIPSTVITIMTLPSPLVNVSLHLTTFVCFVLSSILLYRVSPVHSLARFPGPFICRISNVWLAYHSYIGDLNTWFDDLHKMYGPIVRVGPNDLSIIEATLLPDILGQQGMPKGPAWDGKVYLRHKQNNAQHNLLRTRDLNVHARLRKQWARAFGSGPMQDYEESLIVSGTEFIEHLHALCRSSRDGLGRTDIAEYIGRWSFDFMGDIAFGESFGLMRDGDKEGIINSMKAANKMPTITMMLPWTSTALLYTIPFTKKNMGKYNKFAVAQVEKRLSKTTERRDLFYHLAVSMKLEDDKPPVAMIVSNVSIAIFGGFDTTATALSGVMYYLLRYPDYLRRLREELDIAFPPSEHVNVRLDKLADQKLLNAIINEVLRLLPPFATGLQRAPAKNSGGKMIGDIFINEDTAVFVPPYAIHRDPRYFYPKTDEFWPERWYIQRDDIILNRSAFIPFSIGPANCIGKSLALSEMRFIAAMLVYNFDFWFDNGYDPEQWDRDLKDRVLLVTGKLPVKLRQRKF